MDLKDPLFSVILFFTILLIGILIGNLIELVKKRVKESNLKKVIDNFEYDTFDFKIDETSLNALLVLALAYEKEGDFEKALKIYLWIYKNRNDLSIIENIVRIYLKAGFLDEAKRFAYIYLKYKPRDVNMLKYLIVIDERLGNLKEVVEIIEIFEELEVDLKKEKANALFKLITRGCDIEFCKSVKDIYHLYELYPCIKREFLEYLFRIEPIKAYSYIKDSEVNEYLDLIWNRDDIDNRFCNILAAKKLTKCEKEDSFEIEVLKYLNRDIADLEFEYMCSNCKTTYPFYQSRCAHCNELFTLKLVVNLTKKENLEYMEF